MIANAFCFNWQHPAKSIDSACRDVESFPAFSHQRSSVLRWSRWSVRDECLMDLGFRISDFLAFGTLLAYLPFGSLHVRSRNDRNRSVESLHKDNVRPLRTCASKHCGKHRNKTFHKNSFDTSRPSNPPSVPQNLVCVSRSLYFQCIDLSQRNVYL